MWTIALNKNFDNLQQGSGNDGGHIFLAHVAIILD